MQYANEEDGREKKKGKNGHWAKKSKNSFFFSKEKNGRTKKKMGKKWEYNFETTQKWGKKKNVPHPQKKKRAKNGHFKKKCPTTSKPFLDLDSNTIRWKDCQMEPNHSFTKKNMGKKMGHRKKCPFSLN